MVDIERWAETKIWTGEREDFIDWCREEGYRVHDRPWALFARWWKVEAERRRQAAIERAKAERRRATTRSPTRRRGS